jgi:epoxyqueuosine reductase
MKERLLELLGWLAGVVDQDAESLGRVHVDTGPLLERELAVQAGLGWIGKNCCLISPRWGSWLLLGELLLRMSLQPDETWTASHCGRCTRCLDACPTGALVEPYVLDARRCLAYLTIELRGTIGRELRPLLGQTLFGCDICQEVCPWNQRFSQTGGDPDFQPRPELINPSLLELIALDDMGFRRRFRGSPIVRSKRRGLLRNVAVALGNWGHPAAKPFLRTALDDPDPLLREHCSWALDMLNRGSAA